MKTIFKAFCIIAIFGLALGLSPIKPVAADSVVPVYVLEPSWTAPGGGGVFSAYIPSAGVYNSPGTTGFYDGREAGIIKAGLIGPGVFDEGLFGFKPTVTIDVFASGTVNYEVNTQAGVNPVWMTIEIDTGVVGDRADNTTYQHVPTTNPAGWHSVNAGAGLWAKWDDYNGTVTTPAITLAEVAALYTGLDVVRAYLRLGMGDSYYNSGTGTYAWIDQATLGGFTYDFQLTHPYTWWVSTTGSDSNFGTESSPFLTIQKAIDVSTKDDTINVTTGTYFLGTTTLNVNKDVTLNGVGNPLIQVSGTGDRIIMTTAGATLQGFQIEKTDKGGVQNIIYVGANNLTIQNNKIWGHYVYPEGDVSRAMVFTGGLSGLLIHNNEIFDLRQPAYISGVSTGMISNNFVYRTKGWVLEQGNLTFAGNTWGTGVDANVFDIAILAGVNPIYYTDVPAISAANNGAVIEDQRLTTPLLSVVYVDDSSTCTSDCGGAARPYSTITAAIARVISGGTIYVAEGTYTEALSITKDLHLIGAGTPSTTIFAPATLPASSSIDSFIIGVVGSGVDAEITGFTISGPGPSACGSIRGGIFVRGGANANIHHNTITDIRDNATPLSGCQNGVAIWVGRQADATTGTATIAYNTIVDYQKGGIVVDNIGSSATITDNVLTGAGTIDITAQNGIQISRGATATLTGNTITGNSYHNSNEWDWDATGVLLYESGAVTFGGGNNISGNDSGVYITNVTGPVTFGAETFGAITAPLGFAYTITNGSTYPINLSSSTFNGVNFSTATPNEILALAPYIWDGIDRSGLGIATLKSGYQFVNAEGSIQRAIDAATAGDTVLVGAGTYDEDVNVNKTLSLIGAGSGTTAIRGIIGGDGATVRIAANNVTVEGFTITRLGNNLTDWDNPGLNFAGIAIQNATTGSVIQDNTFSGNRTGIDINNSSGHSILNNLITDNRTGLLFRNQTDNLTVTGNDITNNWTVGILFLDASLGTNSPVQTALDGHFNDNNISGNWYGQVVDRQTGGALPLPGTTNLKNFVENWWGTTTPIVSTANSAEPGYSLLIPEAYGGTSVAPVGQPDILGTASANIVWVPICANVSCSSMIYPPVHNITKDTFYFTIQSAISDANANDSITVAAGTYPEVGQIVIDKNLTIVGANKLTTIITPAQNTGGTYSGDARGWFLVQPGVTFNLSNVTLDGAGKLINIGILSKGPGTIENNILKNIGYNPSGPDYAGRGIAVYDANMTIRNNLLQNIGRIGIYMYGTGITAGVIDGNTYVGKGEGNWLDYGIEIEGGAVVEVKNNVISDCLGVASVDGSGSAGLLITTYFAGGSTANIHDNTFSDNSVGVYVGYNATDTSSVIAHQNRFIGNEFGMVSTNPLVVADHNYWGTNALGLIEAQIDGNVTFKPYWLDYPMSILSGTLVTPVFVDDDYAAMIDCGTHICGYDAFATVEDGVAAVTAGGVVNVAAGTYNPPATIALNKALSILGPTTGEAIVSGVGGATVKVFEISESHVTIQDLTITLATAPTVNLIGLLHVPDKAITDINITDNVIYVAPQSGAMSTWFAQAINIGQYVTDSTVSRNTIYNTRGGLVVSYNAALTIADNVIYNTKGGIMNYTGSAADAANRVMTNNSWNGIHNEWDIVWNSGGGPYDLDEHELVLLMSQANNDAYIVSQMPTVYTTPAQLIYGNRSHVFVNVATGTTTIKNDNGNMNVPYAKIQDGIDAVVPGGKVIVASGTYVEDPYIDKALFLLGPNAEINPNTGTRVAEALILPVYSEPDPTVCETMVYIDSSDVTIKGFTFNGDNPGLTSGIDINGADVDACILIASYEGIGNTVVENNILKNATYAGMDFYNYFNSTAATSGNYIRYNKIDGIGETTYNWGIGILVTRNFYADVSNNVITHTRTGIQADYHNKTNPGTTGSVSNNQVSTWKLGLFLNQQWTGLTPLTISGNTFTAENYTGATNWSGILVSSITGTANANITNNTIIIPDTDTHPGYTAGYNVWNTTTTAPLTISGGSVTGGDHGVFVNNYEGYSSNANNTSIILTEIRIDGAAIAGISIWDSPLNTNGAFVTAELHRNVITNSTQGVLVTGTDATVTGRHNQITATTLGVKSEVPSTLDLEENWWGSAVKSDFQTKIDGSVDYNPWCGNPECTTLVYEVTPGFTIQGAIDAASAGDMINVAPGTYPEHITINKALTLTGANNATTIINGGGTGVVAQITASNVILQGFTIQGSGTTDPQTQAGLTLAGVADCTVTGNIFTNNMNGIAMVASTGNTISNNTITSNLAWGIALADLAGYPASTGNIISGNTITASAAAGIYAGQDNNNNQYLTNTITGNGDGLYLWKSSNNTVTGNTISGNTLNGIHLMGSANNNIAGNIISGNLEGIRVRTSGWPEGAYPSTPNTIFHNQITGNTNYALDADANLVTYMAEANWWGAKTGPAAGTVTSNVDFSQWCGDVACTRLYPILTGIPENTLTTWDKTYNWTGTPGASWYILNVRNATGALIKNIWVSAADAQCDSDLSCSYVIPSMELANGLYSWRVQDYGAYGYGIWTEYKSFVLDILPTNTIVSPLGTLTSWDKTFQWTGNAGATWYILNVRNASNALIKNIWVSAADAQCASDTSCSFIIPNFNLANGSYSWRVQNYGGYGYGLWTAYQPFVLNILPLNTLVSPVTTMTSWDKTFQWTGNAGATWYILNVRNNTGALIKNIWVSAIDAQCASDTSCTYIIPGFNLANGSYSWRVQNYGFYGYGQWTAYQPFVLNILPMNTLVSPLGTVTGWDKTFQWTGNAGATWYILNVRNASDVLIKNIWVSAADAQCASDTSCTYIIPGFNLANGSYSWRVQNYGVYGYGNWSAYQAFLLQ